jgi:RNA polymerase sigma-70 factor, ECF subfamily
MCVEQLSMIEMPNNDSSLDLESLLSEAKRGCSAAKGILIERYYAWILSAIRIQINAKFLRKESCADMAQSLCIQVLEHLSDFEYRGEESFRCWLYAWTRNIVRNRRRYYIADKRDDRREVEHLEQDSETCRDLLNCLSTFTTPSQTAIAHEEIHRIESAMDRLPQDYCEVITQARLLGLPHTEIARRMHRSPAATRVLLHRAMARLTEILTKDDAPSA